MGGLPWKRRPALPGVANGQRRALEGDRRGLAPAGYTFLFHDTAFTR